LEKGLSLLAREALLGFIVPNKFMQADYGQNLRDLLVTKKAISSIVDFGSAQVFRGATTYTCLLFLCGHEADTFTLRANSRNREPREFLGESVEEERRTDGLRSEAWTLTYSAQERLLEKIEKSGKPLPFFASLAITGVKTGANDIFTFELVKKAGGVLTLRPEDCEERVELEAALLKPYWKAESLKRYLLLPASRLLLYPYESVNGKTTLIPAAKMKDEYPRACAYLTSNKSRLEGRQKGKLKGPSWYGLSFSSALEMFDVPKLVTPTLSPWNAFSFDGSGHLFPQGAGGGCGIVVKEEHSPYYVLGVLNSRLLTFFFQQISSRFQGGWFAYEPRYLRRIPIPFIAPADVDGSKRQAEIIELAKSALALLQQLAESRNPDATTRLRRQVEATERRIDRLVYELYELTDAEIAIVEAEGG
jgi:hypothetical protein